MTPATKLRFYQQPNPDGPISLRATPWASVEFDPLNPRGFIFVKCLDRNFAPIEEPFERVEQANERFEEFLVDHFGFELIPSARGDGATIFHLSHPASGVVPPIDPDLFTNLADDSFGSW
jgi:hypothetical protein